MAGINTLTNQILSWGEDKGILGNSDPKSQFLKCAEEVGELASAISGGDIEDCMDAIGDVYVTLTMVASLLGVDMESCIDIAYREISGRTGNMVDGVFVREAN